MSVKCINKNTIRDMSKETFINITFFYSECDILEDDTFIVDSTAFSC